MERICDWMPRSETEACKEMIDNYFPVLLNIIKDSLVGGRHDQRPLSGLEDRTHQIGG